MDRAAATRNGLLMLETASLEQGVPEYSSTNWY